jgi:hypothetical protein
VKYYVLFIGSVMLAGNLVWIDFAGKAIVDVFKHYRLITMGMMAVFLLYVFLALRLSSKMATTDN